MKSGNLQHGLAVKVALKIAYVTLITALHTVIIDGMIFLVHWLILPSANGIHHPPRSTP
ncbi:hypothetical protein MBAV_001838 [Candidatus Magnetobacterium bavaricum]|uniref:Uncharacterized protein n=1 Tax=Candidatus Magnetobacterium bavaricum TaxID=29290 RepID=A0A0F3GZ56_9BACT|nr:hypothetical protein MBAV_001838 [Candidatus Magnetobacterium bavaricum]